MSRENNALIVEFLGWKKLRHGSEVWRNVREGEERHETPFAIDWNWLMPLVIKIANLPYKGNSHDPNYYDVFLRETDRAYGDMYCEGDIINHFSKDSDAALTMEKIYNRCVEFIKWYNKQEKRHGRFN